MEHSVGGMRVIEPGEALPAAIVPKGITTAALAAGHRPKAIVPTDMEQVWRLAVIINKSGMAPNDFSTAEKISVALMHGLEIGLPPMMAMQRIAVINNRPCIWGDAVPALALGTGQVEDWEERIDGEGDKMVAICRVKRKGVRTPAERSFSVDDAKKARLWGKAGPWQQYPKRMLAMRARVAFRDLFADALGGLYIAEEVIGIEERPEPVDITPVKPNAPKPEPVKVAKVTPEKYQEMTRQETADYEAQRAAPPTQSKPLPPAVNRKVTQEPAPGQEPAQDDGLDIPAALRREPPAPDLVKDTKKFKIHLHARFEALKSVDELQTIWNDEVLPRLEEIGKDDQEDLMAVLDYHERRLEP